MIGRSALVILLCASYAAPGATPADTRTQSTTLPAVRDLKDGWNQLRPGGETICAKGTPYHFYVRRGSPAKLWCFSRVEEPAGLARTATAGGPITIRTWSRPGLPSIRRCAGFSISRTRRTRWPTARRSGCRTAPATSTSVIGAQPIQWQAAVVRLDLSPCNTRGQANAMAAHPSTSEITSGLGRARRRSVVYPT